MRMRNPLEAMLPIDAFKPRNGGRLTVFGGGGMTLHGDGGGGGGGSQAAQPTQTTVQNTNIPDYAQPYVENMLNAAQAQIYNPDMTTFQAYKPYSTNPADYVAGFSPLQQQAQSSAANLQLPGQYQNATGAAMLGTGQALNAGNMYNQMATNPYASQAFMSPYIQNALNPQLAEIQRQGDITGQKEQSAATQSGAFGGSREALMAAENQRNTNQAKNQAVGQGYQNAFNAAQQAQQFGANLGLQGAQAGIQGAGQLAGIGGQELAAQQGIIGTQAQQGASQQANQQNIINQAVQNYATAQQYPFLQLGMLNSMLRGLPMQQSSTQMYQAAPNAASQLAGLGTAGLGAAAMYNAAKGAKGGLGEDIKGYAPGGAIPMSMMSNDQLKKMQQSQAASPMQKLLAPGVVQENQRIQANPEAAKMLAQTTPSPQMPGAGMPPPQQVAAMPQTRTGLGAIGTGDVIPEHFAAGGIMAFADEGQVPAPKGSKGELDYTAEINKRLAALDGGTDPFAGTKSEIADIRQEMKDRGAMTNAQALTRFGLGMMNAPSGQAGTGFNQFVTNVGRSGTGALDYLAKTNAENAADRKLLASTVRESEAAKYARDTQNLNSLISAQSAIEAKKLGIGQIAATREGNKLLKEATLLSNASNAYSQRVNDAFKSMAAEEKNKFIFEHNPSLLWDKARNEVYETLPKSQRELLQLAPPSAAPSPNANPSAAPVAGGANSGQVLVTIPAMNGQPAQTFYAPNQAAADAVNAKIKAMQATQQNPTAAAPIQ